MRPILPEAYEEGKKEGKQEADRISCVNLGVLPSLESICLVPLWSLFTLPRRGSEADTIDCGTESGSAESPERSSSNDAESVVLDAGPEEEPEPDHQSCQSEVRPGKEQGIVRPSSSSRVSQIRRSMFTRHDLQSAVSTPFWSKLTHGFAGFLVAVLFLSVGSCAVAFSLMPVSNPLEDPNVWQCAVVCSAVWVPVTILFEGLLLQQMLYEPLQQTIPIIHFFTMWCTQAFCMSTVLVFLPSVWVNPAPMNGVFGGTFGIIMNAILIFFAFIPRLGRAAGVRPTTLLMKSGNPLYELQQAALWVLLFFVAAVIQLIVMLALSAFLLCLRNAVVSAFVLPVARMVYLMALGTLAEFMRPETRILGYTMAMVTVGVANAIAVGSAATWQFTLLFFFVDIGQAILAAVALANLKIGGHDISELLLLKERLPYHVCIRRRTIGSLHEEVSQVEKETARDQMIAFLIASEVAEVVVAMNYSLCWLVVKLGPNASGFSGNGTSDFGLQVPDDTWGFVGNILLLFGLELVSFAVLKEFLRRCFGVILRSELEKVLVRLGPVMAAMSAWLVLTAFCFTMIHCGLDFSLKWEYL